MNQYKLKLIILLTVQVIVTIIHKSIPDKFDETDFYYLSNWSYWTGMGWGIFTIIYALRLGCTSCGARQVFRGFSIFSLRWPEETCHKCGSIIE